MEETSTLQIQSYLDEINIVKALRGRQLIKTDEDIAIDMFEEELKRLAGSKKKVNETKKEQTKSKDKGNINLW